VMSCQEEVYCPAHGRGTGVCEAAIKKEKGKSEKLRRATILLKADINGQAWEKAFGTAHS
jgi:hypothetical protein